MTCHISFQWNHSQCHMSASILYCLLICGSKNEQNMSWSIVQLLPFINYNQYVTRLWYQVLWMRPPAHITHSQKRPRWTDWHTGMAFPVSSLSSQQHNPIHPFSHIAIPFSAPFLSLSLYLSLYLLTHINPSTYLLTDRQLSLWTCTWKEIIRIPTEAPGH